MKQTGELIITLENIGNWFDSYVVKRDGRLIIAESHAKKIPRKIRIEWLKQLRGRLKMSPDEASALLHIAQECQ